MAAVLQVHIEPGSFQSQSCNDERFCRVCFDRSVRFAWEMLQMVEPLVHEMSNLSETNVDETICQRYVL